MNTKLAGGILLIVGTSIGGGMLALPMVTAENGFISSSLMLVATWVTMTMCALFIMEVNLWFPSRNNMITMAKATLGRWGEVTAWVSYMLLLYALLTAYVSGGMALFDEISAHCFPLWFNAVIFVVLFGYIVYKGIKPVDYVNRALMVTKLGSLLLLIVFALPYLKLNFLLSGRPQWITSTVTVMMTSFGFATIVPSLRSYFNDDVKQLRLAILIGSLIPLICYLLWEFAILGSLPREGLIHMVKQGGVATDLSKSLSDYLQNTSVTGLAHLFTVICVLTAFLGVSLCLVDFLADGLKRDKNSRGAWLIYALTFLPPLAIVLFKPSIFIKSFNYAGICAVILVVLLPALMVWSGRYHKQFSAERYRVAGGRWSLIAIIIIAAVVIVLSVRDMVFF